MVSEISQTQKDKFFFFVYFLICGIQTKRKRKTHLSVKWELFDVMEGRPVGVGKEKGEGNGG
jgi:hypothetical protein